MPTKEKFIPNDIELDINKKGFYLYNWISPKDVKNNIELRFVYILSNIFIPLMWLFLVIGIILLPTLASLLIFKVFFILILSITIIITLYLFFIGILKSYYLMKNSYIIITDKFLLLNGKILKQDDYEIIGDELLKVEKIFNRKLFSEFKDFQLLGEVKKQLISGYDYIYSKKIGSIVVIVLFFYGLYAFVMGIVYLLGISLIWFLSIFILLINKFILIKVGHKITLINNLFLKIDESGLKLMNIKNILEKQLKEAQKNNWEEGLLLKINNSFKDISLIATNTINYSILLKTEIQKSDYKDMFNFVILNSWIKNEIYSPLSDVRDLLLINKKKLGTTLDDLTHQINNTKDEKFSKPLLILKLRLELQMNRISDNINILNNNLY